MSLSNLTLFPYIPIDLYQEYKHQKKITVTNLTSLCKSIQQLFNNAKSGDKLAQLILFDFHLSINHFSIYKENITGKRIEQRLSSLFALSTGDELSKENPKIETLLTDNEIKLFEKTVLDLVCSNYRDKGDLFFFNSKANNLYKLSIKSLVPTNNEINFGAFEFQSTIKGISGITELLQVQERKRVIDLEYNGIIYKKIGLGSSTQLASMIAYIKAKGKLAEYLDRFKILLQGVYKDDFLIYIKHQSKFIIYIIDNKDFINLVLKKVNDGFISTRIEGNAIRITDLKLFKEIAKEKFEFDLLTVIPDYNAIESLLLTSNQNKISSLRKFIVG